MSRQPPAGTQIDWTNPITIGLKTYITGLRGTGHEDIVDPSHILTPHGTALIINDPFLGRSLDNPTVGDADADGYNMKASDELIPSGVDTVTLAGWVRLSIADAQLRTCIRVFRASNYSSLCTVVPVADTGFGEWSWYDGAAFQSATFTNKNIDGDNLPHHLALTLDGQNGIVRGYIDGDLDYENLATDFDATTRDPVPSAFLAREPGAARTDNLGGSADKWGVWHRVLDANEIRALYKNPWQLFKPQRYLIPLTGERVYVVQEGAATTVIITDVDGNETWLDGATGLVISGSGFA